MTGSDEGRASAKIVQVGQRRVLDLAIEVPSDELGSIATIPMWTEIFDKLAAPKPKSSEPEDPKAPDKAGLDRLIETTNGK